MNAPAFPPNPSFGQYYGNWVWSGSRWVCTNSNGVRIVVQVFRAAAPYTPSPGLITAMVETIGGGGGGGAVSPNLGPALVVGGAGGGSGGYSRIALAAGLVLGGVNVTIGAGGATNAQGGTTSFGSMCVANGGFGADDIVQFAGISPGQGANAGIGDVAFPGATGATGFYFDTGTSNVQMALACAKGGELWGGANVGEIGPGGYSGGPDSDANTGAGGQGAIVNAAASNAVMLGGAGGSGICIVTEYCWADTVDAGCGCGTTMSGARVALPTGPHGWGYEND